MDRSNAEAMNDRTGKQKLLQQLVHRLKQGDAQTKTFDAPLPNGEFVQLQCMPFEDESQLPGFTRIVPLCVFGKGGFALQWSA